jgi:DNA-binding response OmpR family regulator
MVDRILIVEDEPALQDALAYNLTRQGYNVDLASDGAAAIQQARSQSPDLIVLDIMLPIMDGFEVCRIIRQDMAVPILILTARDDEIDRVIGLELGADDYLTKPFSMREFLARVKALLRRVRMDHEGSDAPTKPEKEVMVFNNLRLDLTRREVSLEGNPLALKPKEYE